MTNGLYAKVATVSKAIGSLQPDKRNQQQKYDYISADKILERAGSEMAAVGLVVVPALVDEKIESVEYQTGKWRYDCRVDFVMKLADSEGNTDEVVWFGRGSDYSVPDKAMYKAITSGHKYFLMKLFNVGVGNEDSEYEQPKATSNGAQPDQPQLMTDKQRKQLHAVGKTFYGKEWDTKRAEFTAAFKVKSSNDWTVDQANKIISGINNLISERDAEQEPLFAEENTTGAYSD